MDRDDLYRGVLRELRGRLQDRSAYNIVRMSGLLRQLFLDSAEPLINIVKRKHGVKPFFRAVRDAAVPAADQLWIHWKNPAGISGMPESSFDSYGQDAFLALNCGQVQGKTFAVKHVVKFGAYVLGGVHNGVAKDPEDHAIAEIEKAMQTGELTPAMLALEGIAMITERGLEPLSRAVGGVY